MLTCHAPITLSKTLREALLDVRRDRLTFGGQLITYLTQKQYNIVRFPTHPDRLTCLGRDGYTAGAPDYSVDQTGIGDRLASLLPEELQELQEEFAEVVAQMQSRLRANHGNHLVIYRSIGKPPRDDSLDYKPVLQSWPAVIVEAAIQAAMEGLPWLYVEMDVVSGWSLRGGNRMYGDIVFERTVSVDDVLILSNYFDGGTPVGPMEPNELLVVNRAPTGLVPLDPRRIDYSNLGENVIESLKKRLANRQNSLSSIVTGEPCSRQVALHDQAYVTSPVRVAQRWPSRIASWLEDRLY